MNGRRPQMALLLVLALGLGLALAQPPAEAEDGDRTTLLLKCRDADVPGVVKALAGLDIELYRVDTMQPVHLAPPEPPPEPPPALLDAAHLYRELLGVLARVDGAAAIVVDKIDVSQRRAQAKLRVTDLAVLDAVREALAAAEAITAWTEEARPLSVGDARPIDGKAWWVGIEISFSSPPAETDLPTQAPGGLGYDRVLEATASSGAQLVYASRERERRQGAVVTRDQTFEFDVPSREVIGRLLSMLPRATKAIVAEVSYAHRKGRKGEPALLRLRIKLAHRARIAGD